MYSLVARFIVTGEGWQTQRTKLDGHDYEAAGRAASRLAHIMDDRFGDSHFWTVDLCSEHGAMFQLFHGRLS